MGMKIIAIAFTLILALGVYLIYGDGFTLPSVGLILSSLLMIVYCIMTIKRQAQKSSSESFGDKKN